MAWWEQWLLGLTILAAFVARSLPMANAFNDWMKRRSQMPDEDDDSGNDNASGG